MVVFQARIPLGLERRTDVLRSLRHVLGETRAWPGCLSCRLCVDVEDREPLVLLEEWTDLQCLRDHLRSEGFKVVLSAIDCASDQPEIRFDSVSTSMGMEFVYACRQGRSPNASAHRPAEDKPDRRDR